MACTYGDEVLTVQPPSADPVTVTYGGHHMRRKAGDAARAAKCV